MIYLFISSELKFNSCIQEIGYFCNSKCKATSKLRIYNSVASFHSDRKTFVTIGTFDGVHIGHQQVIKKLVSSARKKNAESVLLTFFPHPRMVLHQGIDIQLINTIEERISLLEKTGLEVLIIQEFNSKFANQSALEFVKNVLVGQLNLSQLVIGYDHHFGKNREGNFEQLQEYGYTYDFEVSEIPAQDISNISVSSTKIRTALEAGHIEKATEFLGHYFLLTGEVVSGENLGEKLGFPTANLEIKETYKLIPKVGAYIIRSNSNKRLIYGMMNIGYRPTVSGKNKTIEIHFFDFNENLYGKSIQVEVLSFLREEQKFNSIEELKSQLKQDAQQAKDKISNSFID